MARAGIDKRSVFDLLEHADEEGNVTGGGASQQRGAQAAMKPGRPGQLTQADDFYRAFEHVYEDRTSKEVVLRFHKTNIVRINRDGKIILQTGGWYTAATVAALNDALRALGMCVTYEHPVSAGRWIVTDDQGMRFLFKERMLLGATLPAHKRRGAMLLKAYNGGADVPRYVHKHAAGRAAEAAAAAAAKISGRSPPPPAASTQPRQQQAQQQTQQQQQQQQQPPQRQQQQAAAYANYQQAAVAAAAGPRPAGPDVHHALAAALQRMGVDDEDEEGRCVVCWTHSACEVLVPCGHQALCQGCCGDIMAGSKECPMCREKILDHIYIEA